MATDKLQQSYDDVPYPEACYAQAHPDRLATLATILGLNPVPVANCRVLELGCASGWNLIPMAYGLPNSKFTGIDFSISQIEAGQTVIANLGLSNVQLVQADILKLTVDLGEFDYIIAHGVYSWVPSEVREQLMSICKQHLASNGIAYVSYNTYPGWHMKDAVRNMMLYHTRNTEQYQGRVDKARELLNFLAESVDYDDPHGTFLKAYGFMLKVYNQFIIRKRSKERHGDKLLLHGELEEVNDAFYFHEFVSHAEKHGLQYLIESDFTRVLTGKLSPETEKILHNMSSNIIELEQYMDFLRNSTFRQTLLCHADITIDRVLNPDSSWLRKIYVAGHSQPVKEESSSLDNSTAHFRSSDGQEAITSHPVSKAAMLHLVQTSPQAILLADLFDVAVRQVYQKEQAALDKDIIDRDIRALLDFLMDSYSQSTRLIELKAHKPRFVLSTSEKPLGSKVARWQAQLGRTEVTNLRHERVDLDNVSKFLLPHLDGKHNLEELLEILVKSVNQGVIKQDRAGNELSAGTDLGMIMKQELNIILQLLGRMALLEA